MAGLRDVLPAREVADFALMTLSKLGGDQEMAGVIRRRPQAAEDKLHEQLFTLDEPRLCLFVECAANAHHNVIARTMSHDVDGTAAFACNATDRGCDARTAAGPFRLPGCNVPRSGTRTTRRPDLEAGSADRTGRRPFPSRRFPIRVRSPARSPRSAPPGWCSVPFRSIRRCSVCARTHDAHLLSAPNSSRCNSGS